MEKPEEEEKEDSEKTKVEEVEEPEQVEETVEEVSEETETVEETEKAEEITKEEEEIVEEAEEGEEAEEISLRRREEIPEEEIVEERIYTIPLRDAWRSPRKHRVPRAIRIIRSFIQRHMKIGWKVPLEEEEEEGRLIISNEVNEWVWRRGIEKPPRKVRVRAVRDRDGNVTVYLAEGD